MKWTEDRIYVDTCKVSEVQHVDGKVKKRITKIADLVVEYLVGMGVPRYEIF
jgi:hypothetical protein